MNSLYNFLTGSGGNTEETPTEEEQIHSEKGRLLQRAFDNDADDTALERESSKRRLLESQTAATMAAAMKDQAAAALKRETDAENESATRRQRRADISALQADYIRSTPSKKQRLPEESPAELVPPSPSPKKPVPVPTPSRSSKKKPATRSSSKKKPAPPRPGVSIILDDKNDILAKLTVDVIWNIKPTEFEDLLKTCWEHNMFEDASNPKKFSGDILRAFCERMELEDIAEINHEGLPDHEVAVELDNHFNEQVA